MNERARKLAEREIGWWEAHHRKQEEKFIEEMTNLYILQFNINPKKARQAARLRLEAAKLHDIAEKYEDEKNQQMADIYWGKAKEKLYLHFLVLEKK